MKKLSFLFFTLFLLIVSVKAQLIVFADNYAAGVSFVPFGGSTNDLTIDNTQSHSGTSSLKINVTTGYTGGAFVADAPKNLSAYNAVTFWAKESMPYLLDGVGLGNNANTTVYAVERNGVALSAGWVKYYVPIPVASKLTAETGLFHFAEGSGEGAYTIWIDDIQYENVGGGIIGTPTAAFATETFTKAVGEPFNPNGVVSTYPVNSVNQSMQTSRAYFTWTSSNAAVASIDAFGAGTALSAGTTNITAKLGAVDAAGILTVNVTAPLADPTEAAPTPPARNAADVLSLFSGAYADVAGTDWNPYWGQSTIVTEVNIAGNPTKKYASLNYQGVQFASAIDASGMTKLHIDVWTPNCTSFDVYPIVIGQPEQKVTLTPTLSGWNSFDINLSDYTIPLNSIIQFKFVGTPFGSSTVYYDNLYFYTTGAVVSEPTTAAPAPTVATANVIALFSNAYTNVPVDTWSAVWDAADVADVLIAGDDTKKYTNLNYAGVEFTSNPINATAMEYYHVDIWTPNSTTFKVKLVDFGADAAYGGGDDTESELTYTPAQGSWVSYDIPLSDFTGLASRAHLAQMLFIGSNSTVFVDNVYFYNTLLSASVSGSTSVCKNTASPNVTFTGANGTAPYTFTYKVNGSANQTITTTSGNAVNLAVPTANAGTFIISLVSVSDAGSNVQAQSGSATVVVNNTPTAAITASGATTNVCPGKTVTLTATLSTSYLWSTGAVTQSIVVSEAGSYTVAVTNAAGCSRTSAATVVTYQGCPKPSNPAVSNITGTSARLGWTPPASCAIGYQLQVRKLATATWTTIQLAGTSKNVTGLTPNTTYEWRVQTGCRQTPPIGSGNISGANFTTAASVTAIADYSELKTGGSFSASIYPNPAASTAVLRMGNAAPVNIAITDLSGKMLWQSLNVKDQQVNLPVGKFAPGMYIVTISNGQEQKVIKMIKE